MLRVELQDLVGDDFDLALTGFDQAEIDALLAETPADQEIEPVKGSLSDKFLIPPFSVMSAREGWWQDRKRFWLSLGIESELGRADDATFDGQDRLNELMGSKAAATGTSIFDPVLCELAYSWFCPPTGTVLDPFAGGSVRGIVASKLGRQYVGVELRSEQVKANNLQGFDICDDPMPVWHNGDSRNIVRVCDGLEADFLFSCPPYADLEVYSDNAADLSTLGYQDFKKDYANIIAEACKLLKDDSFACFVVGEVRDQKSGNYYNFVGDTVQAFLDAGLQYYNEAILVTAVGSLPVRAGRQFAASRKLGKTHQNVLVFVKGDGKKAAQRCGLVEVFVPEETAAD
jgi:DNA modification methylase